LKDNLQSAPSKGLANQLVPVTIGFVPPNLEIREKALDGFLELDSMDRQFIVFKIVFEIGGSEALPVGHGVSPALIITHSRKPAGALTSLRRAECAANHEDWGERV
jgi:hypothetical protein